MKDGDVLRFRNGTTVTVRDDASWHGPFTSADHVLVTRGKKRGRAVEDSDAIRYWPICPEGHAMTYRAGGTQTKWECRPCLHATVVAVPAPTPTVPPCTFCGEDSPLSPRALMPHPWRSQDVLACPSCAQALRDATPV